MSSTLSKETLTSELKARAIKAMENSYSPYSKRQVGAAILLSNGKIYSGCNVENSSFGGTVCAERVAVWKAVSEEGPEVLITEVAVGTDASPPWSPCGFCRQVINEFAAVDCKIHLVNLQGEVRTLLHRELLPHGFDRLALEGKVE
jgi:cytidine deaminase